MIWQSDRALISAGLSSSRELKAPGPMCLCDMILSLRTNCIESDGAVREYESAKRDLRLPLYYELISGAAKPYALDMPGMSPPRRIDLLNLADRKDVTRAYAGSLRHESSGMRRYPDTRHFSRREPPTNCDGFAYPLVGLSKTGKALGLYLARPMMESIRLHHPTDWATPDIRAAAWALKTPMIYRPGSRTSCSRLTFYRHPGPFGLSDFVPFTPLTGTRRHGDPEASGRGRNRRIYPIWQ